jgi:hypothetical protein
MGATVFDPSDGTATVESLLSIADDALYAAKAAGRNRVVLRLAGSSGSGENSQFPVKEQASGIGPNQDNDY